jgi:hypothetical protein
MLKGRTFSILGDSYSTFKGFVPEGYAYHYPNPESVADVLSVQDTWWCKLVEQKGMRLLVNESFSGATVCTHGREYLPASSSFVARAHNSFCGVNQQEPDYIFAFGGTNDSWLEREIGQVQYGGWNEEDLKRVIPAFCYILHQFAINYKKTKIVTVINTDLHPEIGKGILLLSAHYGAIAVELHDIHKQDGHPTALGMSQITEQICEALEKKGKK